MQNKQIAKQIVVSTRMAALWRGRFLALGLDGWLKDTARPVRTPKFIAEVVDAVLAKTT
jgi:hypothetical protein